MSFNMNFKMDTLETERLILRPFKMSDLDDYIEYSDDKNNYHFLPDISENTKEYYRKELRKIINRPETRKRVPMKWAIELKEEKKVIGDLTISSFSFKNYFCDIGWIINQKYQKKGYAYEATSKFIQYLFESAGFHRIEIAIWEGNIPSLNLAKKLGFKLEGTLKEARFKDNKYLDVYCLGLLNHKKIINNKK